MMGARRGRFSDVLESLRLVRFLTNAARHAQAP